MKTKHRIMIIDDDRSLSEMVKLNLECTNDFEVLVENQSLRAVNSARNFAPDLILLDYIMPGLDGGDVAKALKEDRHLSRVPVIMITALISNQEMDENGTSTRGGQLMLAKPIKFENLQRTIQTVLAQQDAA
ncbi:MAG: response regulator [Verrucomicrobiae bacterium]|nr:response regulator [Verrucomicrobiae bacterium]